MPGQPDGSIIIDTEINSDGFKAGSAELLDAIKALSAEVKNLGQALKDLFGKTMAPDIDTSGAERKIAALETEVQELQAALNKLQNAEATGGNATPQVDIGGVVTSASSLQRQIDAISSSIEKLEPTFQKALSGGETAMDAFQGKATTLEKQIAKLREQLEAVGQTRYPTQEYAELSAELEKAGQKLENLLNRQDKMQELGVKENSAQWRALQYDLDLAAEKYDRLLALQKQMEASGNAFQMGADTAQYTQMEAAISSIVSRLQQMRSEIQRTNDAWAQMPTMSGYIRSAFQGAADAIRTAFGNIANSVTTVVKHPLQSVDRLLGAIIQKTGRLVSTVAKFTVGKLVSGLKSAASSMAKMLVNSKAVKSQFSGLISGAKKFALSLLGAKGVWALLRKAISAYMSENQQLANTLSACWSSIGNLLGPIITKIINLVAQAISYVTAFLKLFGVVGKSTSKAIGKAAGAAKDAADEVQTALASFDELEVIGSTSKASDAGGSGADAVSGLPSVELPDWAKLMADQLKAGDWVGAAKTLTSKLNEMVEKADWAGVGRKIGYYLNGALAFLATFFTTFDWKNLGKKLAALVNNIVTSVDWANLGTVLAGKFRAVILTAAGFLENIDPMAFAKGFSDFAIAFFNGISDALKNVDWQQIGNNIATFLRNIDWSGIATALFDCFGAVLGGLSAFLWGLIEDAWNDVVNWWHETAYEDGKFTIEGLLTGIVDALKNIGMWIYNNIFKPFIDGFKAAFGIASPSKVMAEQGRYLIEGLLQGIREKWTAVKSFISEAFTSLTTKIVDSWNTAKTETAKTWNTIASTISNKVSQLKSKISTGFENAKNSITSKMQIAMNTVKNQNWYSVGSNICTGISNGINAGWSWLKNTVSSLARGLLNAAKSALGIHSPSRMFRDEVGLMIGYGVGEGVEDAQPSILKTVSGVANAIADEFAAGDYALDVTPTSKIDGALDGFSDKIANSFITLMDRLQAIADRVAYTVPAVANGIVPYSAETATPRRGGSGNDPFTGDDSAVTAFARAVISELLTTGIIGDVRDIRDYSRITAAKDFTLGRPNSTTGRWVSQSLEAYDAVRG